MADLQIDYTTIFVSVLVAAGFCFACVCRMNAALSEMVDELRELQLIIMNLPQVRAVTSDELNSLFEDRPDEGIEKKVKPLEDRIAEFNAHMDMDF